MRYIFTALKAEADTLIEELKLKSTGTLPRSYENADTVLTLTGTGPFSAAASCGAVLGCRPVSDQDIVISAGIAAAVKGAGKNSVYIINKIHDLASGRDYYPDIIPSSDYPEAALMTGAVPYDGKQVAELIGSTVLYDMEGAALMHAASVYLPPHRIALLKLVSDFGEAERIAFDPAWAKALYEAVIRESERMYAVPPLPQKPQPDFEDLADDLHATLTMKRQLAQALRYCELAGIDWKSTVAGFRRQGRLPADDKADGKKQLEDLINELRG